MRPRQCMRGWMGGVSGLVMAMVCVEGSAFAQTFTYELRITGIDQIIGASRGASVRGWVEGRSTQVGPLNAGEANLGVMLAGPSASQSAQIVLVDELNSSRLLRSVVAEQGPGGFALTGRPLGMRGPGPIEDDQSSDWHSQDRNGPGATAFPSSVGNESGAFDQAGDRLYGWSSGPDLVQISSTNPFADFQPSPIGSTSPWRRL